MEKVILSVHYRKYLKTPMVRERSAVLFLCPGDSVPTNKTSSSLPREMAAVFRSRGEAFPEPGELLPSLNPGSVLLKGFLVQGWGMFRRRVVLKLR